MSAGYHDTYYFAVSAGDDTPTAVRWISESQARVDVKRSHDDPCAVIEQESRERPSDDEIKDVLDVDVPDAQEPDGDA